ncbi:hypothetical protein N7501_010367 [Penicillium viridicatum]|nr:hypothetical protein N7501_010367 [Penicillium viridicatum]
MSPLPDEWPPSEIIRQSSCRYRPALFFPPLKGRSIPADCPGIKAWYGETGRCGRSQWLIKVVDRSDCDQSADCPEAGARHGQTSCDRSR